MSYLYLNGQYLPAEKAKVSCSDRGFLLGDGIFTTLKYSEHGLHHFADHYNRLSASAKALDLPFYHQESELAQICVKVIENNQLSDEVAAVRITFTRGHAGRGLDLPEFVTPSILVSAALYQRGADSVSLAKSSICRHSSALTSQHKTLNYLDAIMAREFAKREGHDDALFCNENNFMACTTAANIFFVEQGIVKTPALDCGILPGTMRRSVLDLCAEKNIPTEEGEWKLKEVLQSEEVFITNSLVEVLPVHRIGEKSYLVDKNSFGRQLQQYLS